MNNKREHGSSVTIQNKVFVCGGYDDQIKHLKSIEMYDLENDVYDGNNNGWTHLLDMKYGVFGSGIKNFQNKNQILLIGGEDNNDNSHKLFFTYDIHKNQCIQNPDTLQSHSFKPGIVIENHDLIYVVGDRGYRYSGWGVVEYYDIRSNKWFFLENLNKLLNLDTDNRLFQCILHT